jgi:hypothetical protein
MFQTGKNSFFVVPNNLVVLGFLLQPATDPKFPKKNVPGSPHPRSPNLEENVA